MKAIVQDRYGSADVLSLAEVPQPTIGDRDVLIRVHAAGLDPSVLHIMTGLPHLVRLAFGLRRPKLRVRGFDVAGRIEAVGRLVTEFHPGDEVFGFCKGAFAEFASARADRILLKPANLTFEQAATVPVSSLTALQGLRDKASLQAGQRVLIIGAAGGVGTFAVQIAKAFGAHVTGVCSTTKVDLVRSIGADEVIDYTRDDFLAQPQRYDVILDTAGLRPLTSVRRSLTPRGTLVIVGGEGGSRWFAGLDRLLAAAVLSRFGSQRLRGMLASEDRDDLLVMKGLLEAGKVTPVIDRAYPLSETAEAVRTALAGHARGKVVITVIPTQPVA